MECYLCWRCQSKPLTNKPPLEESFAGLYAACTAGSYGDVRRILKHAAAAAASPALQPIYNDDKDYVHNVLQNALLCVCFHGKRHSRQNAKIAVELLSFKASPNAVIMPVTPIKLCEGLLSEVFGPMFGYTRQSREELTEVHEAFTFLSKFLHGPTPLIVATAQNRCNIVKILLHFKADPHQRDKHGLSALHIACARGSERMILNVLKNSRDEIDLENVKGFTPLHYAAVRGAMTKWSRVSAQLMKAYRQKKMRLYLMAIRRHRRLTADMQDATASRGLQPAKHSEGKPRVRLGSLLSHLPSSLLRKIVLDMYVRHPPDSSKSWCRPALPRMSPATIA